MEPKGDTKVEGVRMSMGALDCPICYEPLDPLIYQCGVGHLICKSCRANTIPRTAFERCFGMEHVVESIEVPCCFAKNGCTKKTTYIDNKKHEKECRHAPCFCPEPGCDFSGPVVTLYYHLTCHHKWPSTAFKYHGQFNLRLQPGPRILQAPDDNVFLMNVVPVVSIGHTISLICLQREAMDSKFRCSVVFSCFTGHSQVSTLDTVRSSSLSDGMPKDFFCVVPKAPGGEANVVLRTTIFNKLVDDEDDKLEDEDEDEDEDESEDEDDESYNNIQDERDHYSYVNLIDRSNVRYMNIS